MADPLSPVLLDAVDVGLALLDSDDRIAHANPALEALLGRSDLVGSSLSAVLGSAPSWAGDRATVPIPHPEGGTWEATLNRRRAAGQALVTVRIGPTAAQLAALTRKLAHDINNQLQVVSISGGTLATTAVPNTPSWEDANEICEAVEKAHKMLTRLQRLARSVPMSQVPAKAAPRTPAQLPTILLVESHDRIGEATARVLNRSGYKTTALTDPSAALDLFASAEADWGLAILSMRLRETTGVALARMLRRAQPGLPIVLCVAGVDLPDEATRAQAGIEAVIQKPFSHAELIRTVGALIKPGG